MIATVSGKTVQQSLSDLGTVVSRMPASSDDFPSLQDALNSGETVITIPNGNYVFDSQINVSSHSLSSIRGDGNVVLDFSNLIGGVGLEVDGGLVEISPPTISPKAGSNKIIFPSNTALSKGDIVILWNPEDFSLNKYRNYYRDGFMAKIAKVDESGEVTIFGPVPRCNLSSVRAFKFSTTNPFSIEGLKIIPPQGGTGVAIRCRSSVYLSQSLSASDGGYAGIELDRCFDVKIDVTSAYSNYEDAYPIILSNSQNFFINGYNGRSTKHSIGVGGGSALGSVPVRDGIVSNCILENDGISGIGAADSHGNAVNISYNNCIIKSAANIGGRDIRFKSCTIYARSGILDGSTIYGAEVSGGVFSFTDITCVMDNAVVHGFPVIEVFCRFPTDDIYLHIDNIVIKGEGVTSTDRPTEALIRLALSPTEFTYSFYVDIGTVHCMNGIRLKNLFHIASTQEGTTTVPFAKSAITVSSPIPNSFDELIFMGVDDFSGNITKYLREPTIIP